MRERGAHILRRAWREGEEVTFPREVSLLGGKSSSKGGWHASLGEGLACISRGSSAFNTVRTAATGRAVQQ
jgi:hypothetical protein